MHCKHYGRDPCATVEFRSFLTNAQGKSNSEKRTWCEELFRELLFPLRSPEDEHVALPKCVTTIIQSKWPSDSSLDPPTVATRVEAPAARTKTKELSALWFDDVKRKEMVQKLQRSNLQVTAQADLKSLCEEHQQEWLD